MRGDTTTHAPQHFREIMKPLKNLEIDATTFSLILRDGIANFLNLRKFGKSNKAPYLRIGLLLIYVKYVYRAINSLHNNHINSLCIPTPTFIDTTNHIKYFNMYNF